MHREQTGKPLYALIPSSLKYRECDEDTQKLTHLKSSRKVLAYTQYIFCFILNLHPYECSRCKNPQPDAMVRIVVSPKFIY